MTYLGTIDGPFDRGCDPCRSEDVPADFTVERFGVIARRCEQHANGLRGTAMTNRDGTWSVLYDAVLAPPSPKGTHR